MTKKHDLKCKRCGKRANVVEICPDADDEYFCSQECIDKINEKEGNAYRLLGVFALNEDGSTGKKISGDIFKKAQCRMRKIEMLADTMKDQIITELKKVKRSGIDDLISFLEKSDFFNAPASTKYHGSHPGGLAEHSWHVFQNLDFKDKKLRIGLSEETVIICGLLHDLCKANFYVRNGNSYKVQDEFPVGHGEKSVFIIQRYIKLTDEEVAMIRWHMNAFDMAIHFYPCEKAFRSACDKWPGVVALFTADYEASTFMDD